MHFYIIFGTNLLIGGLVPVAVFLPISVFRKKGISNGIQMERNLREDLFLEQMQSKRLGVEVKEATGRPRGREARPGGVVAPHPRGPLVAPPAYFFRLYILLYPKNIQESHETTFPLPQPSVTVRSHMGTFSNNLPEGDSITEGFYINTIASLTFEFIVIS